MRKLLLIAFLVLGTTTAFAVPVDCLAALGGLQGQLSALTSLGPDGCFHQDKIFYNFTYTGAGATQHPASSVNASHVFQVLPDQAIHGWLIAPVAGQWTQAFTWGFNVRVCSPPPNNCGGAEVSTATMFLF